MIQIELPYSEPTTSKDAAVSKRGSAGIQRKKVFEYIKGQGIYGATAEEVSLALNLDGNSVRPRIWELTGQYGHDAVIYKSRETRLTLSGRKARIYRVFLNNKDRE
jgi:hypothetical protein